MWRGPEKTDRMSRKNIEFKVFSVQIARKIAVLQIRGTM